MALNSVGQDLREIGRRGELKPIGTGHPVLFGFSPALEFERFDDAGGYPKGFLQLAYLAYARLERG